MADHPCTLGKRMTQKKAAGKKRVSCARKAKAETKKKIARAKARKLQAKKSLAAKTVVPNEAELNRRRIVEAIENERIGKFLIELAGPDAPRVLHEIAVPASAEKVAKNANLKVSGVRMVLNKLHSHGIVEYARVRDENTGWLSYIWNVKLGEVLGLLQEKEKVMSLLHAQEATIAASEDNAPGSVFLCAKGCGGKISFEEAFDSRFRCGHCGAALKSANGKT
ncbi:MAG: hypothetical protein QXH27_03835 [Candidatus Micrarchaeia archaeon]